MATVDAPRPLTKSETLQVKAELAVNIWLDVFIPNLKKAHKAVNMRDIGPGRQTMLAMTPNRFTTEFRALHYGTTESIKCRMRDAGCLTSFHFKIA
jgi:hypothetical protein